MASGGICNQIWFNTRGSPWLAAKDPAKRVFGKHRPLRPAYGHVVPNIGGRFLLAHAAQVKLQANALGTVGCHKGRKLVYFN